MCRGHAWGERNGGWEHLAAAVDALRVGEHQLELLGELGQPAAGVTRGGDQDLGVALPRMRVLIIYVRARHRRVVILQCDLPPERQLVPAQLRRDGLALCAAAQY